jgi:hypothetical protein
MGVIAVGFVQTVRRKEMRVNTESVKTMVEGLANKSYEDGWKDCEKHYADQAFSAARTNALTKTVLELQKENKLFKKKLSLATRLIKFAQMTSCGSNGEFDRFFEEGFDFEE